jgi:hypothetical protein
MKRFLPMLLLAACSEPPVIRDAGHDTRPEATVDAGRDAVEWPDVEELDAAEDVLEAGAEDAGTDAALDALPDVDAPDAASDAATDAAPVRFDLAEPFPSERLAVLYQTVCAPGPPCTSVTIDTVDGTQACTVMGGIVRSSFRACTSDRSRCYTVTVTATDGGNSVVITGATGLPVQMMRVRHVTSDRYTAGGSARRNTHVQFFGDGSSATSGAIGIPGRTVDPAWGDAWLLGCREQ